MSNFDKNVSPSFFSILTANVRYDKRLSASEKIFYSEISALTNSFGFCSASNNYFMNLYDCDKRTIQKWLKKLCDLSYIKIEYISNNSRKIYLDFSNQLTLVQNDKSSELVSRKVVPSMLKNFIDRVH